MTGLVAIAALLALSGCEKDAQSTRAPNGTRSSAATGPSTSPTPSTPPATPAPGALGYHLLASQPVPVDIQGTALLGDHAAYVEDERRLVWMSWRTGERRTVYRSVHGSLFMLDNSGRYQFLVDELPSPAGDDPSSPRLYVELDMLIGRVTVADYPPHARVVGELNDARIEIERAVRPDGQESWRSDLVLVDQQPDPDVPRRPVTSTGLVVEAAYDRRHRVVWTERHGIRIPDPQRLWTEDLFKPGAGPHLLLDDPDVVPYDPIVGNGYVGWSDNGQHLALMPLSGGPVTRVSGRVATATWPVADGPVVAAVLRHGGRNQLLVFRLRVG